MNSTSTVCKPMRFPDWILRTLSSKKICRRLVRSDQVLVCLWRTEHLTVLWGSIWAILRARSMAFADGLQSIGISGSSAPVLGWEKWSTMSNISAVLSCSEEDDGGFSVSKHIIPWKQSSIPSLWSTFLACTLSPLVNICFGTGKDLSTSAKWTLEWSLT